ncbi:hypothetical protein A2U01_0111413, partial [Trifolium medium]|nr:hypothetical protein [Trifolium medium]
MSIRLLDHVILSLQQVLFELAQQLISV